MHAVRNQEAFWAYLQQFFDLRTKNDQALDESDVAMSSQDRLRLRAKDPSVLDTIMAGTQWFGSPQAGDAIVVIAANMEGGRKTNAKTVAKALGDNHTACLDWPWGRCRAEAA
jgi:hypothetical protein